MCARVSSRALSRTRGCIRGGVRVAGRHHPHPALSKSHEHDLFFSKRKKNKVRVRGLSQIHNNTKKHGMHAAAGENALPAGAGTQARGVGGTPYEFCCVARWPAGHSWGFPPAPAGWRCAPGSRAARRLGTAACVPCSRDRHDFRAHARLAPGLRWRAAKHLGQAGA